MPKKTVGVHEAEDVASAAHYARQRLSHSNVFLFGRSMGAAAILRAVHEHAIQPDAVMLEAVFDTMLNTVRNRFRAMQVPAFPSAEFLVFWGGRQWGFDGYTHNPSDYAASVRCPVLLMHGAHDTRMTIAEARGVFDAVPGTKEFVTFEHSGGGREPGAARVEPARWRPDLSGVNDLVSLANRISSSPISGGGVRAGTSVTVARPTLTQKNGVHAPPPNSTARIAPR